MKTKNTMRKKVFVAISIIAFGLANNVLSQEDPKADAVHSADHGQGWELFEMKAYIKGEWKILRLPPPYSDGNWALFNLTNDPGETTDLSDTHPEVKKQLLEGWGDYVKANNVFDHNGHFDSIYYKVGQTFNR